MPIPVEWSDVALRLVLTIVAGVLLGFNRTERGRTAGLRTVTLVCLAASISMIQANLLMTTTGKASDSFVVLDLMRFPLGILTGMGFIGGGAILRRGNLIQGVTTAATLWIATVIGLCIGGGQILLGMAALALAMIVLWAMQRFEQRIPRDRRATLTLNTDERGPGEREFRALLKVAGFKIVAWAVRYKNRPASRLCTMRSEIAWRANPDETEPMDLIDQLSKRPGIVSIRWDGQGSS
jgi:putative Mg2+ transporter-C (MgtC) family protein